MPSKALTFALTFLSYASVYNTRIAWSYNKERISDDIDLTSYDLGLANMLFMFGYYFSKLLFGSFVKKIDAAFFLSCCLMAGSITFLTIPIIGALDVKYLKAIMIFSQLINGSILSFIYPCLL